SSCIMGFGSTLTTNSFSFYTVRAVDFNLPNHRLTDSMTVNWNNTCTSPTVENCTTNPQNSGAGSSSLVNQLPSVTATPIHNAAHRVVTTVGAGATVHDFVSVSGGAGNPFPTGTVTVSWFTNGTCANGAAATSAVTPLGPSGTVDVTAFTQGPLAAGNYSF